MIDELKKIEILKNLKEGNHHLKFRKVNGELREMTATLSDNVLSTQTYSQKESKKKNDSILNVFDVEINQWRSLRWENLIEFNHSNI